MTTLFALGQLDPLLVSRFSGFDTDQFIAQVRLLGDGSFGPHEVLQSSGIPAPTAQLAGIVQSTGDRDTLRRYQLSGTELVFRDGNGDETDVRVLSLAIDDYVDWFQFSLTMVSTQPNSTPVFVATIDRTAIPGLPGVVLGDVIDVPLIDRTASPTSPTVS